MNGGVKGTEVEDGEEGSSFLLVSKLRATKWRGNPSSWQQNWGGCGGWGTIPLPGVNIKGNRGGGAVIPPPGTEIEVSVVGEEHPGWYWGEWRHHRCWNRGEHNSSCCRRRKQKGGGGSCCWCWKRERGGHPSSCSCRRRKQRWMPLLMLLGSKTRERRGKVKIKNYKRMLAKRYNIK